MISTPSPHPDPWAPYREAGSRPGRRRALRRWAVALSLGLLAACTYQGGIDNPITIKATWFSYLAGDDIRAACTAGALTQYRLIYNGNYEEQLRSYEVATAGSGRASYKVRVQTGQGLDLTRLSFSDPLAPARWDTRQEWLNGQEMAELEAALAASGAFDPAPQGLRLASEEFYWIMSACRNGVFVFNAWRYPSQRFAALRFPGVLLRHDQTQIALNPPRKVPASERSRRITPGDGISLHFDLQVDPDGFVGR